MEPLTVKTPRLTIRTNDLDGMQALLDGCTDPEMQDAYRDMMEVMRRCPDRQEWGCEWNIILTQTSAVIGGICRSSAASVLREPQAHRAVWNWVTASRRHTAAGVT